MRDSKEKIDNKRQARRAPISGPRNVLTVAGVDNEMYEHRIVNDDGDRVKMFQARGWEIVQDTDDTITVGDRRLGVPSNEGSPVVVSVGGGKRGVLMRIPREWFEEDQQAKQDELDKLDDALRDQTSDGFYGKVKIER